MSLTWQPPKKSSVVRDWHDPDYAANAEMGRFKPASFLESLFILVLPSVVFWAAIIGILVWWRS